MHTAIRFLLVMTLLVAGSANAAIYKCVKNGQPTFQDRACDPASTATVVKTVETESMTGCYQVTYHGWESASPPQIESYRVKPVGNGEFKLESIGVKEDATLPLKTATSDELKAVGTAFHMGLTQGLSLKWELGTPNQRPVGLYKGTDSKGENVILAYFMLGNGLAKQIPCP